MSTATRKYTPAERPKNAPASRRARRTVKALRRHVGDPKSSDQMVYVGCTALGTISRHGRQWLALNLDGRLIGRFETRSAAFGAVLEHAGGPAA